MKGITLKKIFTGTLLTMFLTSILFLSGFTYQDYPSVTETLIYNENGEEEQDEGDELDEKDGSDEDVDGEENKIEKWICGKCGYVYDPEDDDIEANVEPGTSFEDLPEDWVCPVCGASKDEFEFESEEDPGENGRLARLRHVLAMRSKHVEVLSRVIEKMESKDPMHPSIPALQHALQSSSKSIHKAQEAIEFLEGSIDDSVNGTENDDIDEENDNDDTILENQEDGDEETSIIKNSNAKGNRGNSEDKRNDKKVKENNGRGRRK